MLVTARTVAELPLFLAFMASRGITIPVSDDIRVIGRVSSAGELIGVVLYNGFNGCTCSMHCAGDGNWISREFLRAAFEYPFVTGNMVQIFAPVPGNNLRALKLNRHLGFEVLHRIAHGWEYGVDLVMMGMNKATCRWIRSAEVRREQQAA